MLADNFFASAEGIDGWDEAHANRYAIFQQAYAEVSPDFQTVYGYDFAPGQDHPHVPEPGSSMPARGNTSQIAHRFGCLAVTLEMPFKDTDNVPQPEEGWSPRRCVRLARRCWTRCTGSCRTSARRTRRLSSELVIGEPARVL